MQNFQEFQNNEASDWSKLSITNSFLFSKIFSSNPNACKKLLEILLGFKIDKIEKPQNEYVIQENLKNHAVRFDIFTQDSKNLYDIEIQTSFEEDLAERSRYYQSIMDVDTLKTGKPYKNLKNSIIIFICTFDPFKKKKAKYEFKNFDLSDKSIELGDRTTKIFFNVNEYDKIKNNKELKALLKFFSSNYAETDFTSSLTKLVKIAKENTRWRQDYMTYERWAYYRRQEGAAIQKAEDDKLIQEAILEKTKADEEIKNLQKEIENLKNQIKQMQK